MTSDVPDSCGTSHLPPRKRRILIVDTHTICRVGWHYLISVENDLEICGEASSVAEALDQLENSAPDIVVTNLLFPDGNGLDLVSEVRARHPQVSVLVVSMFDEKLYGERAIKAGASGYIMMETAAEQLVNAIRRVLSGRYYISDAMAEAWAEEQSRGPGPKSLLDRLTKRELEIFTLTGQGLSLTDIAGRLGIKPRTVDAHRAIMVKKLGFRGGNELLRAAVRWRQSGGDDGSSQQPSLPPQPPDRPNS